MGRYEQWIDRNLGVITSKQQQRLHDAMVGIAGTGGMGGLVAVTCARIGIGAIKIADNQDFDWSNCNRQYSARVDTIGRNKAECTAEDVARICGRQTQVVTFRDGITADNVREFVRGCDIILDEVEFYEKRARILLHQAARAAGVTVLNCNVVGFGTRIFKFTPQSMTMEEFLGLEADTPLDRDGIIRLIERLGPEFPPDITPEIVANWILNPDLSQRKVPIFGGTPPISSGILVVRMVLELIGYGEHITPIPEMPGYALFDAGRFVSHIHQGKWWE